MLVVVNDSPYYSLASDAFPCLVELKVPPNGSKASLGQLRNIGINAVPDGNVWVQWDDDGTCALRGLGLAWREPPRSLGWPAESPCLCCRLARAQLH